MKEPKQETEIRRYLLGELSDSEREQVEQRFTSDGDYKEEVLMVEEKLLEDYLAGLLSQQERELFHRYYLSAPLQKQKLRMAQALDKYAAQTRVQSPKAVDGRSWIEWLFPNGLMKLSWVVLIVIVVFAGAWWVVKTLRSDGNETHDEITRLNGPQSSVLASNPSVAIGMLSPVSVREGGRLVTIAISGETQVIQLRIPQPSAPQGRYEAVLKDSNGREVTRLSNVPIRAVDNMPTLVLQLPVRIFQAGDYVITLASLNSGSEGEEIGDYSFRIAR